MVECIFASSIIAATPPASTEDLLAVIHAKCGWVLLLVPPNPAPPDFDACENQALSVWVDVLRRGGSCEQGGGEYLWSLLTCLG